MTMRQAASKTSQYADDRGSQEDEPRHDEPRQPASMTSQYAMYDDEQLERLIQGRRAPACEEEEEGGGGVAEVLGGARERKVPDSVVRRMCSLLAEHPRGIMAATLPTAWSSKYDEVASLSLSLAHSLSRSLAHSLAC